MRRLPCEEVQTHSSRPVATVAWFSASTSRPTIEASPCEAGCAARTSPTVAPGAAVQPVQTIGSVPEVVPEVVLTVVDHVEDDGEIAACQKICEERGLRLRVRPYEAK